MRRLANAQVTDDAWLSAVNQQCGLDITRLTIRFWNATFDPKEMGIVEQFAFPTKKGIIWNRPDGGMRVLVDDEVPHYITLGRFLLFAGLIKAIQSNGELSFAKVGGPPINWNNVRVFFNGSEADRVISADAILETIEYYKKDKAGNLVTNKEKGIVETVKFRGIVKIVPASEPQTFF
jgi:hypothetical protein